MNMVRMVMVAILLCVLATSAIAYNSAGKFGMGIRFWGTPVITFSTLKFGISEQIGLEPSLGYYTWKDEYMDSERSNSMLLLSAIVDINAIKAPRGNFMLRLGLIYPRLSSSYSSAGYESSSTSTGFAILGGIGMEHFVNDNFAVNVGTLSGYWTQSPDDVDASSSFMSISSQLVDFSLVWYLK
jgi:hypothetical protein